MDEQIQRVTQDINLINETIEKMKCDIGNLKTSEAEIKVEIRVLCRDIQSLTNTIKWAGVTMITCFGGFFIWAIKQNIIF